VKRLWPFALLAPLAVIAAALWAFTNNRAVSMPTETYATRAEADAHGAFAPVPQGWLPRFIPEGATALRTAHNPGTHQSWGEFRAPSAGWAPIGLAKNQPRELLLPGAPSVVPWWPAELRGRVASGDLEMRGYRFSILDGEKSPIVVAVRGAQVYWWRLARQ